MSKAPVSFETLGSPTDTAAAYDRWVRGIGLADLTKSTYAREVRNFATWLTDQPKHSALDVFTDPHARDYAARDYRRWMLTEKKRAPKGVDLALTSVASLFGWLGLGAPDVKLVAGRDRGKPQGLTDDEKRDVLRAAQRRGVRDHALIAVGVMTGLRVSELAALDTDDAWTTERRGGIAVRAGKGDVPRKVSLNETARAPLEAWFRERAGLPAADSPPLWLTRTGDRLAVRSIRYVVTEVGRAANVELHPHLLRHTAARSMVRSGTDLVTVARAFGWASIDTARLYSDPTPEDLDDAFNALDIDY